MGTSDGLWGLVDGMNDAGLAVSLTFGGRRVVGDGFGVPLILRYVLQTCDDGRRGRRGAGPRADPHELQRHRAGPEAQVPDRADGAGPADAIITHAAVATNHQERVEWVSHARFTATVERERYLLQRLTLHRDPEEKFIGAFLQAAALFDRLRAGLRHALHRRLPAPKARDGAALARHGLAVQSLDRFEEGVRYVEVPGVTSARA